MNDIQMLNRFPRMMQEYLVCRLRENYRANHDRVMSLQTREDTLAYCAGVREKTADIFGPWPQKTPLNIRVTGEINRGEYIVRNIIFDSRPNFPVTGNLYLPQNHSGPRPAVLCLCGHSWEGKAYEPYQSFAQALARMGYITFMIDPLGQGERLQFPDGKGESLYGPGPSYPSVREHNAIDRQLSLTGDWVGRWFIWDGIRALDVMLKQENVDTTHIGVTGNSGGGTMTAFAVACDPRITMSAPSCWVTSWCHNGINEEPQDAEQFPPGMLAAGLEQSDLLLARAPNPVILLTQEQDFFDQRGSLEAFERLRHVYRLLDAEDNIGYHAGPGTHNYWRDSREAMYRFFNRHTGIMLSGDEPKLVIEDVKNLQCTTTGQTSDIENARCLPVIIREQSQALTAERGEQSGVELIRRVNKLLKLPQRNAPLEYRILRPWTDRGYARPFASQFLLETDPAYGAQVIATKLEDENRSSRPSRGEGTALLYIPHFSSDIELREDARIRKMEMEYPAFFACDYRGIGESQPDTCRPDSFFGMYGSDYHYASYASMLGDCYVGWRVHDILSAIDWVTSFGYSRINLMAQGWGTIPAALTALLDDRIKQVTLIHTPNSFAEMAETTMQRWPFSTILPGVLKEFDLPDIYRELSAKKLQLIEPWGATAGPDTNW